MTSAQCDPGQPVAASPSSGQIPSLNGLRAISILLVILAHLSGTAGFPIPAGWLYQWFGNLGFLGVKVFFVISGFLISSLLIKEWNKHGRISLAGFYYRRTLRIFPASYAYVAVISLAAAAGFVALRQNDILHALTYTVNYHRPRSWWVGHLWSLAVEEQFYLLWPGALAFFGLRKGFMGAAAFLAAAPLIRVGTALFLPAQHLSIGESFQTVADALATGCVLAGLWPRLSTHQAYMKFLLSRAFTLVPITLFAVHWLSRYPKFGYPVGESILNVCIALVIHRYVLMPRSPIGRFLNSPPLDFIGVLSYSLYLWQQPFLNRSSPHWTAAFPQNVILVGLCALLSYYLVEKPFLGLRDRLRSRAAA